MCDIAPAALQVECHPYFQQRELKERLAEYGTVLEAWYPIGHGDSGLINNRVFSEIAKNHSKSNVQSILRWHIQEGNVIFPGSKNPDHIRENFDILDFELSKAEMDAVAGLDWGKRFYNSTLEDEERRFLSWDIGD